MYAVIITLYELLTCLFRWILYVLLQVLFGGDFEGKNYDNFRRKKMELDRQVKRSAGHFGDIYASLTFNLTFWSL